MSPPLQSSSTGVSPPPSKSKEKFLSLVLKFVIMMLLICFFFLILPLTSFLLLLSLVLRHRRHRYRRHSRSSSGFSTKQLKRLPRLRFSQETSITHPESDSCAICLDEFSQGQWCRDLVGCGHLFHRKCLDSWLIKVTSCPICRTKVCLENEDGCLPDSCSRRTNFQGLSDLDGNFRQKSSVYYDVEI